MTVELPTIHVPVAMIIILLKIASTLLQAVSFSSSSWNFLCLLDRGRPGDHAQAKLFERQHFRAALSHSVHPPGSECRANTFQAACEVGVGAFERLSMEVKAGALERLNLVISVMMFLVISEDL